MVDGSGTATKERGLHSLATVVDNTLDRGEPLRARERDRLCDLSRPVSPLAWVANAVSTLFGR